MSFVQERKNRWKVLWWWLLALGLIVLNVVVARSTWSLYQKEKIAKIRLAESSDRYRTLSTDLDSLEKTVKVLNTDRGTEEIIRRHLGFMRPDEGVVTILENEIEATGTATTTTSWYQKFKDWLNL